MSPISNVPTENPAISRRARLGHSKSSSGRSAGAAAATPSPTPAPAAVTPPVQKIPLMCTMCGNQLSSVYTAATKTFTHVHQVTNNAPKCPVTGKKFHINASHDVEEISA